MSTSMQDLVKSLITEKAETEETVSISLRISDPLNTALEEISGQFNLTKSAFITMALKAAISDAQTALDDVSKNDQIADKVASEVQDSKDRFFLLNTNYNNDPNDHDTMLKNAEAAGFYGRWKKNIAYLQPGDHIFLYQSGVGFVGYGIVSGDLIKSDHKGAKDQRYARKLSNFLVGFQPIKAREFKDLTKSNTSFRQIMVGLTKAQGEALLEAVVKRAEQNN